MVEPLVFLNELSGLYVSRSVRYIFEFVLNNTSLTPNSKTYHNILE